MKTLKTLSLAITVLIVTPLMLTDTATASAAMKICVPRKGASALLTPKRGKCRKGYKLTTIGAEGKKGREGKEGKPGAEGKAGAADFTGSELETLKGILPHIRYIASGVGGKPTIQFSRVNVQIVDGEGSENLVNGEGNLVIGYPGDSVEGSRAEEAETGSHNLALGEGEEFTSYGGIVSGIKDRISGQFASVISGLSDTASGYIAAITGGDESVASGDAAVITSGGFDNTASGLGSTISGGAGNIASGLQSSISGGTENRATAEQSSISGGNLNRTLGPPELGDAASWIGGGYKNLAEANFASIFGGRELTAKAEYEAIP